MTNQFCIFCEIVAGRADASVVYEDEHVMAFLDLFPANEGHTLVIPKEHATHLNDLDPELGMQVFGTAHRLAQAVRDSGIRCEGVNLILADGAAAGQEVFHVHLHVLPRYAGDQSGFRFGNKSQADREELEGTAEKIRSSVSL
jgi:diadenosine tetraphosphate (Ap4A) HIT family hydrolase